MSLACAGTAPPAHAAYKYRDQNGNWVFTDQPPPANQAGESFSLGHDETTRTIAIVKNDDGRSTRLTAVNECLCVVTFRVSVPGTGTSPEAITNLRLEPQTRRAVLQMDHPTAPPPDLKYSWYAALGSPDAVHSPERPYRVPYGVGSTYPISQAFPSHITHTTPDSRYAVDFALPDGTPVYAAREGIVIHARHDAFRTALAPVMLDQANVVEILHADGTIGVYAHLHWDSIRVRIGAHVARGEYIANSGNTGFSSGPHLHFAVLRNAGGIDVSVPVQFAGLAGVAVTPVDRGVLTAY